MNLPEKERKDLPVENVSRRWLLIGVALIVLIVGVIGWYKWSPSQENAAVEPTPETTGIAGDVVGTIGNVTFAIPTGWKLNKWATAEIADRSQTLSQQEPRLRKSIEQLLAALNADTQILLIQPENQSPATSIFLLTAIPSHGLRLEQVATQFAAETSLDRLIDTSLREDGQPILRIRGEQLTGLDSRALRPQEVVVINNYRANQLLLILEIADSETGTGSSVEGRGDNSLAALLRSIQFSSQSQ